jgi:FKBP-type peptidyl-prolyl cis-trans isomerase FkpA
MRLVSVFALFTILFLFGACLGEPENTFAEQLSADVASIDSHLSSLGLSDDAIKDISGVRYVIHSLGTGYTPRLTDAVTFTYTGKLINGTQFESSTLTDYAVTNLVAGFQIGLPQIPAGSTATIYIPSGYGYGAQAQTGIPANSILVFDITLKKIKVTSTELARLGSDTVAIDEYLTNAAVANVLRDTTGMRYVITQTGVGNSPTLYNRVKVKYTGYLITNGSKGDMFYTGTAEPTNQTDSRVVNFIRGFQFGVMKLSKGAKAVLYLPSGLAFGTQAISASVAVPANSNLIYEVELLDILEP